MKPMTPDEMADCLDAIGWSRLGLAKRTGKQSSTVEQWYRGKVRVPDPVARWLRRFAAFHRKNPPPAPRDERFKADE